MAGFVEIDLPRDDLKAVLDQCLEEVEDEMTSAAQFLNAGPRTKRQAELWEELAGGCRDRIDDGIDRRRVVSGVLAEVGR